MKRVYLLRHGKAEIQSAGMADFERKLQSRGIHQIIKIGKAFNNKEYRVSCIISSPAERAFESARLFARQIDFPENKIITDAEIYTCDADGLMALLQKMQDRQEAVLVAGHNPAFETLAARISGQHTLHLPTGGLAIFDFAIARWQAADVQKARWLEMMIPDQTGKLDGAALELAHTMAHAVQAVLQESGMAVDLAKRRIITRQMIRLAKKLTR